MTKRRKEVRPHKWMCHMIVLLASAWTSRAQDLYLYQPRNLDISIGNEMTKLYGNIESTKATQSSVSDDSPINFVSTGFSFPFYGNSRVRTVGLSPNGVLELDLHQPSAHPCKTKLAGACRGFTNEFNVIGPFATDLYPGPLRLADSPPTESKISYFSKEGASFSAIWWKRNVVAATKVQLAEETQVSFAVSLFRDGRISFYYQDIPEIRTDTVWYDNSLFAGVRAPKSMENLHPFLSGNDKALQRTWIRTLGYISFNYETGFLVNRNDVHSDAVLDLCLVPDRNLTTLEPTEICTTRQLVNVSESIAQVHLEGPEHLFGCLRAGIRLECSFPGFMNLNNPNLTFTSAASLISGVSNTVRCDAPAGFSAMNLSNVELEYVDVHSLGGEKRPVLTNDCSSVGGPTLDYLVADDRCEEVDTKFGEPLIRDCGGTCGGARILDRFGVCCELSDMDCRGACFPSQVSKIAPTKIMVGKNSFASDQLECCFENSIDCAGVCDGCIECALPEVDVPRLSCPSPVSTTSPSIPEGTSFELPKMFLLVLGVIVAVTTFRVLRFYLVADQIPDSLFFRLRDASMSNRRKHLLPEEIEEFTTSFVFGRDKLDQAQNSTLPQSSADTHVDLEMSSGPTETNGMKTDDEDEEEEQTCTICICEFEVDDVCRRLPCSHFFHADCIEEWFLRSTLCAICRADVRGPDFQESDSDSESEPNSSHEENNNDENDRA